jgi:hypothetical protein
MTQSTLVEVPPVRFSPWTRWARRRELKSKDGQPSLGVYVWARFEQPPSSDARPYPDLPAEVIYVGQTNDLNVRPLGAHRHHRLASYRETYRKDPTCERLYVSVHHVEPFVRADARSHALWAYTRYLEALIGWEYVQKYGRRPALDYKRGKDKV